MYLRVFELIMIVFAIYTILSQLLIPALRGTMLFPWLRRETKLLDEIASANQDIREHDLEKVLHKRREDAQDTKPGLDPDADDLPTFEAEGAVTGRFSSTEPVPTTSPRKDTTK